MYQFGAKLRAKTWRVLYSQLWSTRHTRKKMLTMFLCIVGYGFMYSFIAQANSCALVAFMGLILFDILTLIGDLINQFYAHFGKSSPSFSFGYVRVEILVHFAVLSLGLIISAWTFKTDLEFILFGNPRLFYAGQFIYALVLGAAIHFLVCLQSNPYIKVSKMSASCTYLQKCFQSICTSFGLSLSSSKDLSLMHNPLAILGVFSCCIIALLTLLAPNGPRWVDFLGGILIIFAIVNTLWPLVCYTGQILLQTVPAHTLAQLDKALREALTVDGVLEFRNEMFWTLSYGEIAGSLHVRVRRDANEQLILVQVYEKLLPLAPHLTIQVTKDEVGRHIGGVQQLALGISTGGASTKLLMPATVINLDNSRETSPVCSNDSSMSPIPPSFAHKHIIYSSASASSGSGHFNQAKQSNYNVAVNMSTSTKIHSEIDETALYMGDTSIGSMLSSTTSSVFPVETPAQAHLAHSGERMSSDYFNKLDQIPYNFSSGTSSVNTKQRTENLVCSSNAEYVRQNPLLRKESDFGAGAQAHNARVPRQF